MARVKKLFSRARCRVSVEDMKKTTLRELADRRHVRVGAACSPGLIEKEKRYRDTLAREFNCIVAENCMKFMYLHPERARYDFTEPDKLVAFAREHRMFLRGHTLVWHNQVPEWLAKGNYSRNEALDVLQEHIFTVMGHFRGQSRGPARAGARPVPADAGPAVYCWDVVNEALSDDGGWREKSFWYAAIGPDYLNYAFRWAHEADPDAELVYNDYGMELPGKKPDGCYRLLRRMLKAGVPVHAVGFQYHLGVENRLDRARCLANFGRFKDLGLDIQFTEMDMGIKKPITDALRQEQAREYSNRVQIALDTGAVSALMFWGFTDKYSWVPGFTKGEYDEPLLFDRQYRSKPAHLAICDTLRRGVSRRR